MNTPVDGPVSVSRSDSLSMPLLDTVTTTVSATSESMFWSKSVTRTNSGSPLAYKLVDASIRLPGTVGAHWPGMAGAGWAVKPEPALHSDTGTFCVLTLPAGRPAALVAYCRNSMVAGVPATVTTVAEPVTVTGVPATLKLALAVLVIVVLGGVAAQSMQDCRQTIASKKCRARPCKATVLSRAHATAQAGRRMRVTRPAGAASRTSRKSAPTACAIRCRRLRESPQASIAGWLVDDGVEIHHHRLASLEFTGGVRTAGRQGLEVVDGRRRAGEVCAVSVTTGVGPKLPFIERFVWTSLKPLPAVPLVRRGLR